MKDELWGVEIEKNQKEKPLSPASHPVGLELWSFHSPNANNLHHKKESGCGAHRGRNQSATWDRGAVRENRRSLSSFQ